jgi:O-antigen ligase
VLAAILLAAALLATARSIDNFAVLLLLAPIWLSLPFATTLRSLGHRLTPTVVATLALAGTALAAGITAYDFYIHGLRRAGTMTMNPIHMGDLALMLGFVALMGLFEGARPWRAVFCLGPAVALAVVWWTGSRGPLVASAAMILVSVAYAILTLLPRRWMAPAFAGAILGAALVISHGVMAGWLWQFRGMAQVANLLASEPATNQSVSVRLAMYGGAWEAFQASPIYGHGFVGFVQLVAGLAPEAGLAHFEHLHNDLADFAVIGGLCAIFAYGLLLASPLIGAYRAPAERKASVLYLALVTATGYLVMGMTNAMFGILTLTSLFGVIVALCVVLSGGRK